MKNFLITCLAVFLFYNPFLAQQPVPVERMIRKSTIVDCPPDIAWARWTTHQGLKTFFGQDNQMELSIGGPFEIYFSMDAPAGCRGSEGCKVISYLPRKMLSFTWNAPPQFPEIRNGDYHTWVVVHFKELSSGQTEIELHHLGWLEGEDWQQVYQYFDKAWGYVLNWFEDSCHGK